MSLPPSKTLDLLERRARKIISRHSVRVPGVPHVRVFGEVDSASDRKHHAPQPHTVEADQGHAHTMFETKSPVPDELRSAFSANSDGQPILPAKIEPSASKEIVVKKSSGTTIAKSGCLPQDMPASLKLEGEYFDATVGVINALQREIDRVVAGFEKPRFNRLYKSYKQTTIGAHWDFSKIETISMGPALMIAAAFHKARHVRPDWEPMAVNLEDWKDDVYSMLDHLGFFYLTGIDNTTKESYKSDDLILFPMRAGADNAQVGLTIHTHLGDMTKAGAADADNLYRAIMEAVVNSTEHGYTQSTSSEQQHAPLWWSAGAVEPKLKRMRYVVYDQGLTIPGTLAGHIPSRNLAEMGLDRGAISTESDALLILETTKGGLSSKAEPGRGQNRGQGMKTIAETVRNCENASVTITSRCGQVVLSSDSSRSPTLLTLPSAIRGTLISWEIMF